LPAIAPAARVTLRQVAAKAGVSLATVSLALRNDPRITPATRARVRRATRALGYQPDPAVSAFMFNLRSRQLRNVRANIAILPTIDELPAGNQRYAAAIRAGAALHAASEGYSIIDVGLKLSGRSLGKRLFAQGVSGLIILPLPEASDLSGLLDWSLFSAVATSYTLEAPELHCVLPHHYSNMQRALDVLGIAGYRRIGLLLSGQSFLVRVRSTYLATMALHNESAGTDAIAPLVVEGASLIAAVLPGWLERTRPDVIVTNNAPAVAGVLSRLGLRVPDDLGLMSLGSDEEGVFACLEQHPEALGTEAAIRLISMMQRGDKGIPPLRMLSMLEGAPIPGPSLRGWAEGSTHSPRPTR
jgi:DNA-binding LacI/PurR family transcriptional regulator